MILRNKKVSYVCIKCCVCSSAETIQHLFFDRYFAHFVWNTVHITYEIQLTTSFANMFGSWLHGLTLKLRNQIFMWAAALCWSIWLNRNNMVFNKAKPNTSMQVIFRTMYWIRQWSMLHNKEERPLFFEGCKRWEMLIIHESYWSIVFCVVPCAQ